MSATAAGPIIRIDTRSIVDMETFHDVFAKLFGFPGFYGRNMNAWIDCMGYVDEPEAGMTTVHTHPGGVVTLLLEHVEDFKARCPAIYDTLVECSAFVNWRRVEINYPPVLALAFWK